MGRLTTLVLAALLLAIAIPADARFDNSYAGAPIHGLEDGDDRWFVQLASPAEAAGGSTATIRAEKEELRRGIQSRGIASRERMAFDTLWNGVSIDASKSDIARIARIRGVTGIWPVTQIPLPETTPAPDPALATALAMTGADIAQSTLGFTGRGIKVAIMDTGIDYNHPDLGGCFGPGCQVAGGFDFVGNAFTGRNDPVSGPDPMDCNGHGTHVAGITGARPATASGSKGVAPNVTFYAYKVFGCEGSTTADIMIAAMERALRDGNHILNMSIGSAFAWPQFPTAVASDNLVRQGMVVVASIGNNGRQGLYSAGAPGLGKDVIGVASFDNTHINALSVTVNEPGDGRSVAYSQLGGAPTAPTTGTTTAFAHVGRGCNADPYLADPRGRTALAERGGCTFNEKYQRAAGAGATAVFIYNHVQGMFAGGGITAVPGVPGVGISRDDGLYLASLTNVTVNWTANRINAPVPTGGLISDFSSYGLSPDLDLKPDLGAPGGLIRAPFPVARGSYATLSGTSMSAPHVAGAVALLLEARPRTPAARVRDLLQNTARPVGWHQAPDEALEAVHRQGAGMIDIPAMLTATASVSPGKLALGASPTGAPHRVSFTVTNSGSTAVTYDLGNRPGIATRGVITPTFRGDAASISFDSSTVTVAAGGSVTVNASVHPPRPADPAQYGGWITLIPSDGSATLRVPYAGFAGDYQSIVHLGETSLASGILPGTRAPTLTVSHEAQNVVFIHTTLLHQAQALRVEVIDANGRSLGRVIDLTYVTRVPTVNHYRAFVWDLRDTEESRVPPGDYTLRLTLVKALGNEANPAHVETWTSGRITVRP